MKKYFTLFVILFMTICCYAQNEAPVLKDFAKNVKGIRQILNYGDNVRIVQINNENDEFEIVAINESMQVLWRTPLKGYGIVIANFKGKILAVAATEYGTFLTSNNAYKGFLLDGKTGKVVLEKIMYDGPKDKVVIPFVCASKDGVFFKLALRKTDIDRKVHVGLPGPLALITMKNIEEQGLTTNELQVMDFDENLNITSTLKPAIEGGFFSGICCNSNGDVAIAWYDGGSLKIVKYVNGKTTPQDNITENLDVGYGEDKNVSQKIAFLPSRQNPNVFYSALVMQNSSKIWTLGVTKYDFKSKSKKTAYVSYDKETIKDIQKSYKQLDKKIDKPDFGPEKDFAINSIGEFNDRIIVAVSAHYSEQGKYATVYIERSLLIHGFDLNMDLQYYQQLPSNGANFMYYVGAGFYGDKNGYQVAAIYDKNKAIIGSLNPTTGEWDKMEVLAKGKIDATYPDVPHIIWFSKTFILPYSNLKGITKTNQDITLQLNTR